MPGSFPQNVQSQAETLGFDLNAGGAFLARQVEDKTAKF